MSNILPRYVALSILLGACATESPTEVVTDEAPLLSEGSSASSAAVRNLANLRALTGTAIPTSSSCNDGTGVNQACCIIVFGEVNHADGGGGHFCYKPNVNVADNGDTIIKPNSVAGTSPGRWVRALSHDIKYAASFAARYPETGGIEGALLAFGPAPACGEIRLPKGTVNISKEIEIQGRWGCRLVGHGKNETGLGAGTVLRWTGPEGGRVFNLVAIQNSVFKSFMIDGNYIPTTPSGAGVGIRYQASDAGLASFDNHFSEIGITGIKAGAGVAIHVGRSDNTQVDHSTFEKMLLSHSKIGVLQEGTQTIINSYRDIRFVNMTQYGMSFAGGDAFVERCDFASYVGSGAIADVRMAPGDGWATFIANYHEGRDGASYLFESGHRVLPVNLIGNRVYWLQADAQPILEYRQTGPLNLQGNSFSSSVAADCLPTTNCKLVVDVPFGGTASPISSLSNHYGDNVKVSFSGNYFLGGSNDKTSNSQNDALGGVFRLSRMDLALEGSALLWRNPDGSKGIRQYYNSGSQLWTTCRDLVSGDGDPCDNFNKIVASMGTSPAALDDASHTFRVGKVQVDQALISSGVGAPTLSASNGSLYLRTDGPGPNLYVREKGAWVPK